MEENKLEDTYDSKNLLTKTYFRWKVATAIRLAKLKGKDVILDFGCGGGWLENKLKKYEIYGYDINPKKTFIDDYRKVKPTKIFVLDVLEHVPVKEIENILDEFKKLNSRFELVVSIPTENWISRKIRKLVGKTEVPDEHITRRWEILKVLKKTFKLKKRINFFTVCDILKFEHKSN